MHNNIESGQPWKIAWISVKESDRRLFCFNFRFDIGISNLNHMNEFVSVTELKKGRENEIPF